MSIGKYETAKGTRHRVRIKLPNGRRTDKHGFRTKRDAQRYLDIYRHERSLGTFVPESAGRIRMSELVQHALDADSHRAPSTQATCEAHAQKWLLPHWSDWNVGTITTLDIHDWIRSTVDAGAKRDTISKSHQLLGSVMKAAVERRLISVNPVPPLLLPKQDQKQHAYLSRVQVRELLDAVPEHHRALIAVLAYTGIRFGEASALERRSIDLTRGRIHVVRSVGEVKGVLTYGPPKNGKKRTVPMPKALFSMIEPMLEEGPLDGHLFSTSTGYVLRLGTWRTRVFNKALKSINTLRLAEGRSEFPAITPHDLRHTAASLAVQSGANVKVVQRMLGHASAAITLDVYTDLFDSDLDEVATRMD